MSSKKFIIIITIAIVFIGFMLTNRNLSDDSIKVWGLDDIKYMPLQDKITKIDQHQSHAYVVLGTSLTDNGKLKLSSKKRLSVALKAYKKNPESKIIVSGGKPIAGITQAEAMEVWLINHGVPANKIIKEEKSTNTIQNAVYSMKIIDSHRFQYITLITSQSHMRRAYLLFEHLDYANRLESNLVPYKNENSYEYTEKEYNTTKKNLNDLRRYYK